MGRKDTKPAQESAAAERNRMELEGERDMLAAEVLRLHKVHGLALTQKTIQVAALAAQVAALTELLRPCIHVLDEMTRGSGSAEHVSLKSLKLLLELHSNSVKDT